MSDQERIDMLEDLVFQLSGQVEIIPSRGNIEAQVWGCPTDGQVDLSPAEYALLQEVRKTEAERARRRRNRVNRGTPRGSMATALEKLRDGRSSEAVLTDWECKMIISALNGLAFECPRCGAPAGSWCHAGTDNRRRIGALHSERRDGRAERLFALRARQGGS